MPKNLFLLFLLVCHGFMAMAQTNDHDPEYQKAVAIGLGELRKAQCAPCLEAYNIAFNRSVHSSLSLLRAACCAAMCEKPDLMLDFIAKANTIDPELTSAILSELELFPELEPLRQSEAGKKLLGKARKMPLTAEKIRE